MGHVLRSPAVLARRAALAAVVSLAAFAPAHVLAETKTWTAGGTTVTWDDSGNWSPAGAPTASDTALLQLGSFGPTGPFPTITLGASSAASSLVLGNNYTLSGGALTLTTGSVYADVGVYAVISSTLSGTAGLTQQGGGAIRLSNNANTYTGTTNIANGVLIITGQGALGSSSSTVRITDQNFVPSDTNVQGYGGGALFLDARTADITFSRNIEAVGYGPTGGRGGAILSTGNVNLSGLVTTATTSLTPATLRTTRFVSSDGMLTFSGTLNVLGTAFTTFTQLGTTNQATAGMYTLSGALEGTGSLEKTGAGTLFLAPTTTAGFSGAIRASLSGATNFQSTIRITSSNILGTRANTNSGTGAVLDLNGGTVEVRMDSPSLLAGGSAANAFIRTSSGHTPLVIDHAPGSSALSGTLTLGRLDYEETTSTYTLVSRNGYSLDAGTALSVVGGDNNNNFANNIAGLLTFGGTAFWNNLNTATNRTMTISGNGNTLIATNVIANGGASWDHILTKQGTGLLTITGTASTLDGAVNVQNGALAITDFRSVTNNSGTINLGVSSTGASLIFGSTASPTAAGLTGTNKVINLAGTTGGGNIYASQSGASPVIINFLTSGSGNKTLTLGGTSTVNNIVNAGIADGTSPSVTSLTKVGPGTWVFSGTNTYTGATTISDGTLKLRANTAAAGVLPDANAITFAAAGTGYAGGTLEYEWTSGGNVTETLGALTPTDGANMIRLTPGSGTAALVFASLGTIGNAATLNVVGSSGSSTVSFTSLTTTGTLLSPHFFFSGSNFAYAGTSNVLRAPVYGTDAGFVTSPGAATIGTGQNNFDITGAITAQTSSTATTLRMAGSHSLTLTSGATLTLRTGAAGTPGGILATGGTSTISGGAGLTTGGNGPLVIRVDGATDQLTISSTLTSGGSGGINKTGAGLLILTASNAQTGNTNISEGTVRLSGASAKLSGNNVLTNIRQGATLDINGVNTITAIGQFNNQGTVKNSSATPAVLQVGNNNGTGTSYGIMQDGTGKVSVTKVGTGGQSWLGLSTYTGSTTIGSTGSVTVDVLADIGVASGIGRGDATSDATNAASLVFIGSTGGLVYAGVLRPLGSGDPSLALGSASASTNRLFTLAGTGAKLSSTVTNNNAIVWSNTGAIVHGIVGPQAIAFEGTSAGDNTFNPQITDAGTSPNITSVSKAGAGQWNLGGLNNTYSGSTTINDGIFAINAAGALPSTSPLVLFPTSATSAAVFQASGTLTRSVAASAVSGSSSITFAGTTASTTGGAGFAAHGSSLVVALGGTASPTALTWGSGGFVGTGTTQNLVLNSASSLAEVDFRNPIDLGTAARVVNVQDNTYTAADYAIMSGALSGAGGGSLRKIGTGLLHVTGANTYTGTTSVEAGTLMVRSFGSSTDAPNTPTSVGVSGVAMTDSNAVTLGTGGVSIVILAYTGGGETTDRKIRLNTTTGTAQIHANGSGPLVLTNVANDMQAGAKLVLLRGSSPVPNMITGTLTDNGGALSVQVDGGGAIWILTGSNTYTGATTVASVFGIGHDFAMGSGTASIQNGSSVFAYGGDRTISTRVNLANNNTSGFFGDYNLTLTNVSINVSANNNNTFNNIAPGKALTLVDAVTGDMTANRTWQVNGAGTTVVTGSLTVSAGSGVYGLVIAKNGDGTLVLGGTGNDFNRNNAGIDVDRGTLRMGNDNAIRAQSGDGGLTLSPEVAAFDVATFDLNGTQQTINAITATADGTIVIDNSSASDASLTFGASGSAVALFTSGTGTYRITDSGAGRLSIVKTGSAAFTMISGVTLDYSGTTGVTGGSMTIASAVAQTTALAVSGTDSLLALTGGLTNPGLITNVSVGPGSALNLLDGVGSAITSLSSLSLGVGGTAATVLRLNFGDSATDTLGLVGGTLALGGTDATSSVVTFFLTDVGASGNTRYDLVTSSTGGLLSGTYALGATPGGFTSFSLVTTDTAVYALSGDLVTGQSFWTGSLGTAWNSGTSNWSTDQAGTTPAVSIPGSGSDVVIVADTVTTTGTLATTLEQNFRINSLTFQSGTGGTPSTVTIGPGTLATNRLDISPQLATGGTIGITMAADGPSAVTISAPLKLGAAQTWSVASGTLTLSGPLFGEAGVTKSGPGTVVISGTADATFNSGTTTVLTVAAGTLTMTNVVALGSAANANLARIAVSGGGFYYDNATTGTVPNAITLSGGTLSAAGAAHTYSGAISVTAPSTINMRNANGDTSVTTTRNITLSGGLTGTGSVIVLSSTTLASGNPSNSSLTLSGNSSGWSGGLDLRQGMVVLSNTGALGAGPITASGGKLQFATAGGTTFALGQNVSLTSSNAILEIEANASGTPVSDMTVNFTGTFTLGSASSGTTALRLNPATDNFSVINIGGPVILGTNVSISTNGSTTRFATISGRISDGGGNYALVVNDDFGGWGQTNQTLVLTGSNTYGGGTVLASGGLRIGHKNALGTGTLTVTVASTLDVGIDLTGQNAVANAVALQAVLTTTSTTGGLTLSGTTTNAGSGGITNNIAVTTGTLTLGTVGLADATTARTLAIAGTGATVIGSLVNSGTSNTLTNNTGGSGSLAITGNVFLSDTVGTGRTLTLSGSGSTTISGTIANADGGGVAGVLAITNTGTTTLLAANTYTGTTQVDAGTLRIGVTDALPTTGALRVGNASTAGTLDLADVSQTIGSLSVASTATGVTNRILIPTGQTLTVDGSVLFGINANGATTRLTGTGGGAFVVSGGSANFILGGATGGTNDNSVYVDFSGLSVFSASLGSGTFRMGDNNSGTDTNPTAFTLATSNTISAASFGVGSVSGGGQTHVLTLGPGSNVINANAIDVGQTGTYRSSGQIVFGAGDTTGTVRVRGADGVSRATVNLVNSTAATTAVNTDGLMNFGGHGADILSGTWTMASRTGGTGAATATFSFDQGTFDVTALLMGQRTGAGTGNATATVNLGGGTSTIGSLAMAVNTSSGGTSTAAFNVTGGAVTIGAGSGTALNMATASASRTSISTLNLTGGTVTLAGDIRRSGSGGTETATIALNGARLDLGGFAIGSAVAPITLDAQTGGLGNVGEFNGAAGFAKTTTGTLTLFGSNSFGSGVSVGAGTLVLGSVNALGATGGPLAVNGGTLDLGGFSPTVGLLTGSSGAAITSNGAGPSTLTVNASGSGTYAGSIQDGSASVALTKTGAGTLTLAGANTYGGGTRLDAGVVALGAAGALGSTGTISFGGGTLQFSAANTTDYSSRFSAAADQAYALDTNGQSVTLGTALTSAGGSLTKLGSGTLTLSAANTYTGTTTISAGKLALAGSGGIAASAGVSIAPGASLDIAALAGGATVGTLSGSGSVVLGGNTLTAGGAASASFGGVISGSGGFTKAGAGILSLTDLQTFTGAARVDAGTLAISGLETLASASEIFVADGAMLDATAAGLTVVGSQTLGGYGTVDAGAGAVVFNAGAFLSPGGSVGQLDGVGDATFNGGMTYVFEINDATGVVGTSTGWDLFNTTGDLTLAASINNQIVLDMTSLTGSISGTAANFDPNFNYAWKFVVAGSPISSFSSGWFNVDSTGFLNLPGNPERFYVARGDQLGGIGASGTDNELYVVYAAVPEPTTICLAACGLVALGLAAGRRGARAAARRRGR